MRWLLLLVLFSGTAHAQAPERETPPPGLKSARVAMGLSLAATAIPMAAVVLIPDDPNRTIDDVFGLTACGLLVFTPSLGHWYAGEGVTTGLAIRLTAAAMFAGFAIGDFQEKSRATPLLSTGAGLAFGLFEVGTIWDIATVDRAVARHNAQQWRAQLVPMAMPHGGAGLSLAGSF